mmetsp:Transcript_7482/g.8606  ORF Transcript_7482/g.8606 Transcript_7482/m.8606 type:complete len:83 (+) Transcript_7482:173-421(+)
MRKIPAQVLYWTFLFSVPAAAAYVGAEAFRTPETQLQEKLRRDHASVSKSEQNNKELSGLLRIAMKEGKGEIENESIRKHYD